MKILEQNAGVVTNAEVMKVLQDRGGHISTAAGKALASEKLVYQYLHSHMPDPPTSERVNEFLQRLQPLGLSKGETLQLLNVRPCTPVEVHLLVHDAEGRLGEEGVDMVMSLVEELLVGPGTIANGHS